MAGAPKTMSDGCSALAFYGFRPSAQAAEAFYRAMLKWFTELGYPPDKGGVTGPGFGSQLGSFGRFKARLEKKGFRKVTGVDLIATTPDAEFWSSDYYVAASYVGDEQLTASIVTRTSIARLTETSLLPVAREVAAILKPVYGIGYTRALELDPSGYAIGANMDRGELTGKALEEEAQIAAWSETLFTDHVYRKGILRDVYRRNFLTRPHLTKKVGGVPLDRWIRQNARRGKLGEFGRGMHLWEVATKDIPAVRQTLRKSGLILEPEDDGDDDLESGSTPEEALALVLGMQSLDDVIVFDGTGKRIPKREVKKIVKGGRKK